MRTSSSRSENRSGEPATMGDTEAPAMRIRVPSVRPPKRSSPATDNLFHHTHLTIGDTTLRYYTPKWEKRSVPRIMTNSFQLQDDEQHRHHADPKGEGPARELDFGIRPLSTAFD